MIIFYVDAKALSNTEALPAAIPILSEWCSWSLSSGEAEAARAQLDEVARRAGADPLSGKLFWDARAELEKAQLENLRFVARLS